MQFWSPLKPRVRYSKKFLEAPKEGALTLERIMKQSVEKNLNSLGRLKPFTLVASCEYQESKGLLLPCHLILLASGLIKLNLENNWSY